MDHNGNGFVTFKEFCSLVLEGKQFFGNSTLKQKQDYEVKHNAFVQIRKKQDMIQEEVDRMERSSQCSTFYKGLGRTKLSRKRKVGGGSYHYASKSP